jgi:hypothetical protein
LLDIFKRAFDFFRDTRDRRGFVLALTFLPFREVFAFDLAISFRPRYPCALPNLQALEKDRIHPISAQGVLIQHKSTGDATTFLRFLKDGKAET